MRAYALEADRRRGCRHAPGGDRRHRAHRLAGRGRLGKADAVVVLSGSKHERLDRVSELVREGVAPTLVISGGFDLRQPAANRLCREGGDSHRCVLHAGPRLHERRKQAGVLRSPAGTGGGAAARIPLSRAHARSSTAASMLMWTPSASTIPDERARGRVAGEWVKLGLSSTIARWAGNDLSNVQRVSERDFRRQLVALAEVASARSEAVLFLDALLAGQRPDVCDDGRLLAVHRSLDAVCSSVLKSGWFSNGSPFR